MKAIFVHFLFAGLLRGSLSTNIACQSDSECRSIIHRGSWCVEGRCTNPYYDRGCLAQTLPNWDRVRVCTSEDPPDAKELGYCRESNLGYPEIRIHGQNWESSFFGTWILQIVLSEMLDVPVSVETGVAGMNVNLYDPTSRTEFGTGYDWDSMRNAYDSSGDCVSIYSEDPVSFKTCAHVIPEMWVEGLNRAREVFESGIVEAPIALGALGGQYWFVPRFTAERYPDIMNYLGLQGDIRRRQLAEIFKRPTTWKDYCEQESPTNCTSYDGVANRPPETPDEDVAMFMEGLYTGFFRKTEKNDCEANPDTCSGHFADYPCGWTSYTQQQAFHLDIGVEINIYTYSQLVQIWAAANATKSDLMAYWWHPEGLFQTYEGTSAEHTRVTLTRPSQECLDNRVDPFERCGTDHEKLVGSPLGSCDTAPQSLTKVLSKTLKQISEDPEVPQELWSPAFKTTAAYQISELHLQDIFSAWYDTKVDKWGYDPRAATCQWVVDNFDLVESFIPATHPRALEKGESKGTIHIILQGIGVLAIFATLVTMSLTWVRRRKASIYHTQVEYMMLVEAGLVVILLGAIIEIQTPSDFSCEAAPWFVNLGYVLVILPTAIRAYEINKLAIVGKQMQRVRVSTKRFFGITSLGLLCVALFCALWWILDEAVVSYRYKLVNRQNVRNEQIIESTEHCSSESQVWYAITLAWPACLLIFAILVTFLGGRERDSVNDTKILSVLLLCHILFVSMRAMVWIIDQSANLGDLLQYDSVLLMADCVTTLSVFLAPKVFSREDNYDPKEHLPDIFLRSSIMYAEIVGFAGWGSVREPVQIFQFLDKAFGSIDEIAKKRRVFKAQAVSDSYVAATGIPHEQQDHVERLVLFADECIRTFDRLAKKLEVEFGPDTGDLRLRVSIHSGVVTGGFLQGTGSRFQLFGETCTVAHDLVTSSRAGRIQVSEETAKILMNSGRSDWLIQREDSVTVSSGQGEVTTFWCLPTRVKHMDDTESNNDPELRGALPQFSRNKTAKGSQKRLIDWNVEVLHSLLKEIVRSQETRIHSQTSDRPSVSSCKIDQRPLDEVKEVVSFPEFDHKQARRKKTNGEIVIPPAVLGQLEQFVSCIAFSYQDNRFHSFAHASHVVMAVLKYINRIMAASDLQDDKNHHSSTGPSAAALHDHTYGISSDPMTHFACVFSALIHDVDHPGVPNPQLIKENPHLAAAYLNRSVAEQNSFDLSWNMLMKPEFSDLRALLFANDKEQQRFRQLVINCVMATDLGDKELKDLRNGRWDTAFSTKKEETAPSSTKSVALESSNRKATIVIEHIIQASDVSHTMQHWEIYREWNENLFMEMYAAFRLGRAEKNPADFWYEGEIGFFDFYVVPLSKKLDECGVFGISCDENLSYASRNREMWIKKGKEATEEMRLKAEAEWNRISAVNEAAESIIRNHGLEDDTGW